MVFTKKETFQRILAMILAVVMTVAMLPVTTLQAAAVVADAFNVTVTDGVAAIEGATVQLRNVEDAWSLALTGTTDANGEVSFTASDIETALNDAALESANIHVSVSAEGYTNEEKTVAVTAGNVAADVAVTLAETVTLTFEKVGNGSVAVNGTTVAADSVEVVKGSETAIAFVPADANTKVVEIKVNDAVVAEDAMPAAFDADTKIAVVFETTYTVSASANVAENGTVKLDTEATVKAGEKVTISAKANTGYAIESISVNGNTDVVAVEENCTEMTFDVIPDADTAVVVNFVRVFKITIKHNEAGKAEVGGKTVANEGTIQIFESADGIEVKATPDTGYRVSKVSINDEEPIVYTENDKAYSQVLETKDYNIEFVFAPNVYNVTVGATENGTVVASAATVEYNGKITLTVTPDANYEIEAVVAGGKNLTVTDKAGCDVQVSNVTGDIEISATFVLKKYAVTFSAQNGKFTDALGNDIPENVMHIEHGSNVSFAFVPNKGYEANIFDGTTVLLAAEDVYTIENVVEPHSVSAVTTDVEAPVATPSVSDASAWKQSKVISCEVSDNSNGAVTVYIDTREFETLAQVKEAELTAVTSLEVTENGTYYVYAVDEAENFAKTNIAVNYIDRTAPSVKDLEKEEIGKTFSKKHTYTFSVVDEESGVKSVAYSNKENDPKPIVLEANEEGKYTFEVNANGNYYIYVEDNVGNRDCVNVLEADIDLTAPEITELVVPEQWDAESNQVTFKAKDNNAVVSAHWSNEELKDEAAVLEATPAQLVDEENGEYSFVVTANGTYYVYAIDEAGNFCMQEVVVKYIDTTAPVVDTIAKDPEVEWHNNTITVSGTVSDNQTSGIATGSTVAKVVYSKENVYAEDLSQATYKDGRYTFVVSSEEFNGNYYVWAVDHTGRVSESKSIAIKIDKTAPANVTMAYVDTTGNNLTEKVVNVLTFGLIFKEEINIKIHAEDIRDGQDSGIAKYQYQMVADGEALKEDGWVDHKSSERDVKIKLDIAESADFLGKVYVRVFDVAGNITEVVTDTADGTTIVKDNAMPAVPTVNLNGYEAGKWTNENVVITLSGADTISGVKSYQYRTENADPEKENIVWTDMPLTTEGQQQKADAEKTVADKLVIDRDTNATYYFRAVSNTGIASDEVEVLVKVQKTLPGKATETIAVANGTNDWYVGAYPTITIEEPEVNEFAAPVYTYFQLWDTNKSKDAPEKTLYSEENMPVIDADGVYSFVLWTEDEAGNVCAGEDYTTDEIKVDITAPKDHTITVDVPDPEDPSSNITKSLLPKDATTLIFDEFFDKAIAIKLNANCDVSGEAVMEYQKVNAVAEFNKDNEWTKYDKSTGIVVEPNEKFIIYFRAVDMAGNGKDVIKNSTGIVVDNKMPSGEIADVAPEINITAEDTNKTASGIYNGDVTVDLHVFDPMYKGEDGNKENGYYSGLKTITYKIFAEDSDQELTGTLLSLGNEEPADDIVDDRAIPDEDNLIKEWKGQITIPAGYAKTEFNSNNVIVEITAIDNAGNPRTSKTRAGDIKIDIKAPEINITYNNNAPDSGKYYKDERVATIVVTERNFDAKDVITRITNTDGVIPTISGWSTAEGTGNKDNTTHTATITYSADGDYTFDIDYTDLAGNACAGETFAGGTQNPTEFTIDRTNPVIRVAYDNNQATNGNYFNATRTATVTITEHNFTVDRVTFTQTSGRGGVTPSPSWSSSGDTHTATFSYTTDGDYTFDVTMTDMAGNESGAADFGDSVAGKDFIVDTTFEDMITIGGVENGKAYGYNATVVPTININDINLEKHIVTLVGVQKDKTIDLTEKVNALLNVGTETVTGSFDVFKVVQDMDGIYTLKVTSQDKAGNLDEEEIIFTVNRFGSVYVYDQYLVDLIANGGTYVKSVTEDLVIMEYNADKLVPNSLVIEITCDGKPLDNVIYDVTPEINNTVAVGESGWYQYKYTISKDNFTADGVYKISVSSKDATGNTPENNSYEDLGITFRVDSTLAEISSIVGLEEAIINATEQVVKYTVYDTMGIKSIKIYVDGKLVDEITDFGADPNNYTGSFALGEHSSAQSVRIVIEDMSGNITDTDAENFSSAYEFNKSVTVSTNVFVRWYANKPLFWGSIGGVVAIAAALWAFLAAKRKKKEEVKA